MRPLRAAVIGAGHLGSIHARRLLALPEFALVAVADPLPERRTALADSCHVEAVADHRVLLGKIDAAIVATPTRWHHAIALELLRHGVHLLVEKPLAATAAQAWELVEAARRAGVVLQVGHVERFNPAWLAALPHLSEPRLILARRQAPHAMRSTDIGVVLDLMIHDLDLAWAINRTTVSYVHAVGQCLFGRLEDLAHAEVVFSNGCVASLTASRASRQAARSMEIWCSHGQVSLDFTAPSASLAEYRPAVIAGELDIDRLTAEARAQLKPRLLDEYVPLRPLIEGSARSGGAGVDAITAELADFGECIRTGRRPRACGEQAAAVLEIAEQITSVIHTAPGAIRYPAWPTPHAAPLSAIASTSAVPLSPSVAITAAPLSPSPAATTVPLSTSAAATAAPLSARAAATPGPLPAATTTTAVPLSASAAVTAAPLSSSAAATVDSAHAIAGPHFAARPLQHPAEQPTQQPAAKREAG